MGILLCIDGLPPSTSSVDLRKHCERFGTVHRCWVVTDRMGRSLGFGYAEFDPADSQTAIESLNGLKLGSHTLQASIAETQ